MILFDTPGIMNEQRSKLDERMMAAVVSSIKAAEVIIAVVDSGEVDCSLTSGVVSCEVVTAVQDDHQRLAVVLSHCLNSVP